MRLVFGHPESDSDFEDQPPLLLTRSVLPAFKTLELYGEGEYLDDFMARIDVPSHQFLSSSLLPLSCVENFLIFTGYTDSQAEPELNAEDPLCRRLMAR